MIPQVKRDTVLSFFRLSYRLALVGFKLRNEGSYLGNVWYLLNPVLLFLILFFIFFDRLGGSIPSYPAYLIVGILLYNFFLRTTTDSIRAISEAGFIKSVKLQHEALVFSIVIKNIFSHAFEAAVFFIVLLFLGIPFYSVVPYMVFLVFFAAFTYGVSLFLAAAAMYVSDTGNLWQFLTTLLWFATPIFYSIEGQSRLFVLNLFNQRYYFITATRDVVIYTKISEPWVLLGAMLYTFIALVVGTVVFNALRRKFAEMM